MLKHEVDKVPAKNNDKETKEYTDEEILKLITRIRGSTHVEVKLLYTLPAYPEKWQHIFVAAEPFLKKTERKITDLIKNTGVREVYPPSELLFTAFHLVPPDRIRVVIFGQDPYPNGEGMGLAFSTLPGKKPPPSLANIFKEIKYEYPNWNVPKDGDLTKWAMQGVLLLNTCLTVSRGKPDSHKEIWDGFTQHIVETISQLNKHCIYVLWGRKAAKVKKWIKSTQCYILESGHPSPQSYERFFAKNMHFTIINRILKDELKQEEIQW